MLHTVLRGIRLHSLKESRIKEFVGNYFKNQYCISLSQTIYLSCMKMHVLPAQVI